MDLREHRTPSTAPPVNDPVCLLREEQRQTLLRSVPDDLHKQHTINIQVHVCSATDHTDLLSIGLIFALSFFRRFCAAKNIADRVNRYNDVRREEIALNSFTDRGMRLIQERSSRLHE